MHRVLVNSTHLSRIHSESSRAYNEQKTKEVEAFRPVPAAAVTLLLPLISLPLLLQASILLPVPRKL
jgi:hypothetical protein